MATPTAVTATPVLLSNLCLTTLLLLLLPPARTSGAPYGPSSDSCVTLVQGRFFGFFSSPAVFPETPCSWTLQNPDPRRYTVFVKVTKPVALDDASPPTSPCSPRQLRTFQYDSFLETTRTYLGMESFDEVVKLCDPSTRVAFLQSGKQFLQMRRAGPGVGGSDGSGGAFKAEYLVVGNRNPSMPACQMLCQWLEDCLASSTPVRPCGIMQTPCQCWDAPPQQRPDGCYRGGVYLENCIPSQGRDAEIVGRDSQRPGDKQGPRYLSPHAAPPPPAPSACWETGVKGGRLGSRKHLPRRSFLFASQPTPIGMETT
ncbi:hypothetical protein AAFF_G00162350 [Aldrovandia affinis]|uniref:Adhesion G protein-coupled receptor B N-terminal domain-containing protein n=1 Tax=Aldrovandia affinis TaxID=143900 RepID=A0AAD7T0B7_9TELE|nr:hypothetical protein AAFF_G00162350 [Aldrovandia affinis]